MPSVCKCGGHVKTMQQLMEDEVVCSCGGVMQEVSYNEYKCQSCLRRTLLTPSYPEDHPRTIVTKKEQKARKKKRKFKNTNKFYLSAEWQRLRYKAFKKYGPVCALCGATRKDGVRLHVDHIKPRSRYPELELELSNLQILYHECNQAKGAWDTTDWR